MIDPGPHTAWVDCRDTPATGDSECQAFCTCGWQMLTPANGRAAAERLVALHLRNARRRALAMPLGDLELDAIRRVVSRTAELVRATGASADAALAQARTEEADGHLTGQLILAPTPSSTPRPSPALLQRSARDIQPVAGAHPGGDPKNT